MTHHKGTGICGALIGECHVARIDSGALGVVSFLTATHASCHILRIASIRPDWCGSGD